MHSSRDLPNPGFETRAPALQADSSSAEPPGKPKIQEWVPYLFSWGSSQSVGSSALQMDALPAELPRRPFFKHRKYK